MGVFLAVVVVGWVATAAQSYLTSWVGERMLADLRVALFAHIQRLDLGFFERTRPASSSRGSRTTSRR